VDAKFYDGTIFHRVIPNFMIQGGGFTTDMKRKSGSAPIKNEADNGLKNDRGTIAMARTGDPHSATAQFFINSVNNDFLNHKSKTSQEWGYAVFGKVIDGMDVVDAISAVKTTTRGRYRDVPAETVEIRSVRVLK
jgi:peptidyl-prolyl cis-trans isomerase B (cyclophilin B)